MHEHANPSSIRLIGLETLDNLAEYLNTLVRRQSLCITQAEDGQEGRAVSIENEHEIREALLQYFEDEGGQVDKFTITKPAGNRFWYDFALVGEDGGLVPVNIKSTTSRSADNCGSKEGVYYSLTGLIPSQATCKDYDTYFEALREGISSATHCQERQQRDYFFLVCLKGRASLPQFFVQTLRSIQTFTPNGNNPPFQCSWARNQVRVPRTFEEGALHVLSAYRTSMGQRASQYAKFQAALDPVMQQLATGIRI